MSSSAWLEMMNFPPFLSSSSSPPLCGGGDGDEDEGEEEEGKIPECQWGLLG